MNKNDVITFDNLPEAVKQLLQEVAIIKYYLLNEAATSVVPPPPLPEKEFLTVNEVSQMLNISKGTIYNLNSERLIPSYKRGGRIYFDKKEIVEWIRDDRRKTIKQLQAEAELEFRKK